MRQIALFALCGVVLWGPAARADGPTGPVSAATSAQGAPGATPEKAEGKDGIILHVSSPESVPVEKTDTGEVVCMSPCDARVPASAHYRIGGGRPSSPFSLSSSNGKAALRVKPASNTSYWMGVGGVALGGAILATGIGVLVYAAENRAPIRGGDGVDTDNTYQDRVTGGILVSVGGVAVGLWGLATMVANSSTSVHGDMTTGRNDTGPTRGTARAKPILTYLSLLGGAF